MDNRKGKTCKRILLTFYSHFTHIIIYSQLIHIYINTFIFTDLDCEVPKGVMANGLVDLCWFQYTLCHILISDVAMYKS